MDDIQHQQMGYDRAATMFAPDGHILQVEYAEKTIRLGSASIGILCKDSVVIVSDRRKKDSLVIENFIVAPFLILLNYISISRIIAVKSVDKRFLIIRVMMIWLSVDMLI